MSLRMPHMLPDTLFIVSLIRPASQWSQYFYFFDGSTQTVIRCGEWRLDMDYGSFPFLSHVSCSWWWNFGEGFARAPCCVGSTPKPVPSSQVAWLRIYSLVLTTQTVQPTYDTHEHWTRAACTFAIKIYSVEWLGASSIIHVPRNRMNTIIYWKMFT